MLYNRKCMALIKQVSKLTSQAASIGYFCKGRICIRAMSSGLLLKDVVDKFESYAPSALAESWDNVGLLVEPTSPHHVKTLFLTNDLTEDVLDEAIVKTADLILSYHPPLFKKFKRITQDKWKDRIVVKAVENRIAIYSPHTSYDAVKGGVNDWLLSCFDGKVQTIIPKGEDSEDGVGRICKLKEPLHIDDVIKLVKNHLQLTHIRAAYSKKSKIETIASCAGSGASVLGGVEADAYLTGEMSHHEILDAVSNHVNVLLCEHSNTERGFLKILSTTLKKLLGDNVDIVISERDRDPVTIV